MREGRKRRVVVTGMGVVSCFGTNVHDFYTSLLEGKSGVTPITSFDVGEFPTRFAAQVDSFDPGEYLDKKQARRVDPFVLYAIVAGKKALEYAQLSKGDLPVDKTGIILSSGMGGMSVFYDGSVTVNTKGFKRLTPFFVPYIIPNIAGALLAIDLGCRGPNYSISTACATASHSIIAAMKHIQNGEADVMIAGGSEAAINPIGLSGFVACKALSERNDAPEKASRPWDVHRDGFVMGEGAGALVLEDLEHALNRNAHILCELKGGAVTCDAYHITDTHPEGIGVSECIQKALLNAELSSKDIDYINAHATSTKVGDLCEMRAIESVFGTRTPDIPINATKSMIGHTMGAAGAMGSIATINAITTGYVHPTINLEQPEESIKSFNLVPGTKQQHPIRAALTNAFGFGGHNAVIVYSRYQQ